MTTIDPKPELPKVEITPELRQLLSRLTYGHTLDIVENGVVIGRLERVVPRAPADESLSQSLETAGRFMDRYSDAYKELAK